MVFNVAFIDHVIRMVGGPLRLYWMVFVRKDFCLHGQWLQACKCCCPWYITRLMVVYEIKLHLAMILFYFAYFVLHTCFPSFLIFGTDCSFTHFIALIKIKKKAFTLISLSSQFIQFFSVVRFFTSIIVNFAMLIKLLGRLPNPIAQMQNPLTNNKFPNCQSLCQLILNQDLIALKVRPNVPF